MKSEEKNSKTILLTGAAGFIGSNVLEYLFDKYSDYSFLVLDALTYAGKLENIPERVRASSRFSFSHGDVQNQTLVDQLVSKSDVVVHFAAETHVEHSIYDNFRFFETDILGTLAVTNAVLTHEKTVDRFIHISTCEVYGAGLTSKMDEGHLLNPHSPYAAAKAGADRLVYSYQRTYGIPSIILRPFNIFGPRQHLEKVTPRFVTSCILGNELTVHGHGKSGRDFMYVDGVSDAIDKLIHAPREKVIGEIFNIGSGTAVSVLDLAKAVVEEMMYPPSKITFIADRPGQVSSFACNYGKIQKLLGWKPPASFEDGLKKTIRWYKDNPDIWKDQIDTDQSISGTLSAGSNAPLKSVEIGEKKRIKVLFGINKLSVGGAERLMLSQLHAIDRAHFDPHLVTLLPSTTPNFDDSATYLDTKWKKFSFRGLFDLVSWWKLYRYLKQERFDVVLTNLFFTGFLLRTAAIAARIPVIISSELNVYSNRSRVWIWVEKLLAPFTHRIMANSKEVLDAASKQLNLPREKFVLNYSTVDMKEIRPGSPSERKLVREKYGIHPDTFVITTAGRLVEQKGQKYLIEALPKISVTRGKDMKLFIFGEGARRDELEKYVQEQGLESKVFLPGAVPIGDIIAISDVFVLPSIWEGMSLVLLEAMAGALPIVATDISGSRELVSSANGFLVPPKDSDALAKQIQILIDDADLRARLGKASRQEVERFSIENNLKNLYETINVASKGVL